MLYDCAAQGAGADLFKSKGSIRALICYNQPALYEDKALFALVLYFTRIIRGYALASAMGEMSVNTPRE